MIAGAADAKGGPPYKTDAKGACHDSSGAYAKKTLCTAPAAAPKHCRDPKTGKFAKCSAAGAVPA